MRNNVTFGFLNFQTIERETFFVYGLLIGIETKIIVAFRKDKPNENERVQQLCLEIHKRFTEDQLNPFQSAPYAPSKNLQAQLNSYLEQQTSAM